MKNKILDQARYLTLNFLKIFGYHHPLRQRYDKMLKNFYIQELYQQIEGVEGEIVECGVSKAESLITLSALATHEGKDRKVYGFDSFEGFPGVTTEDTGAGSSKNAKKGGHSASRRYVEKMIQKAYIPKPVLVQGFFEDTLGSMKENIALLHIDVDLYESYKTVLEALYSQVVSGGLIAFDEYHDPKWPGATKAIDEFLDKHKGEYEMKKGKYLNKSYIIKK